MTIINDAYQSDFTYELKEPISYQDETGQKETKTLVLYAPSNKLSKQKSKLRQKVIASFLALGGNSNNQNKSNENEKASLEPEQVLFALAASNQFIEMKQEFCDLLKNGCASLEGKCNTITDYHLQQIDDEELEEVMGQYIVNFIIASWMKRLLAK